MSAFVISKIFPSMNIDANQRFIFGLEGTPEPLGSFKLDNIYVPILGSPSLTNFEQRNESLSGYRWIHQTELGDDYGTFKLQKFLTASATGIDLLTFNNDGTVDFPGLTSTFGPNVPLPFEQLNFNWSGRDSGADPYIFNHTLTDSYDPQRYRYSINSAGRGWNTDYNLGSTGSEFGILTFTYYSPTDSATPLEIRCLSGSLDGITCNLPLNANQGINCGAAINMQAAYRILNLLDPVDPQEPATRSWVLSQIDSSFGPNVDLPFGQLNFNWGYASVTNPSPYETVNTFTDAQESKKYRDRFIHGSMNTEWSHDYTLIGNSDLNGIYEITYLQGVTTHIPFKIQVYPFAPSQTLTIIDTPLSLNSHKITNLLNPTAAQDAATKSFVESSISAGTVTLTGSVTGSGNVNGSFATAFSNSQTVSGATQTFNFNNTAAAFVLNNASVTPTGTTEYWINRNGVAGLKIGIIGDSPANRVSYINSINSAPLYFQSDGSTKMYMNSGGLVVMGSLNTAQSKLDIYGGVQNIANEESALRVIGGLNSVKIELQNTTPSTGKLYEIRSGSTGGFDIVDRTASAVRFAITSSGNIGLNMGLATPNAQLQLPNVVTNRQLVLYEAANNNFQFHGFGSVTGGLGYNVNVTTDSHIFYAGVNSTTRNEIGRITGTGDFISPGNIYGKTPRGYLSMSNNATATVTVAATWVKIAGTTVLSGTSSLFDMPVNNRLRYTGIPTLTNRTINVSLTFIYSTSVSTRIGFSIFKNGVLLADTPKYITNNTTNISMNIGTNAATSFATNDYIEIYFNSPNGGVNLTITDLSVTVE